MSTLEKFVQDAIDKDTKSGWTNPAQIANRTANLALRQRFYIADCPDWGTYVNALRDIKPLVERLMGVKIAEPEQRSGHVPGHVPSNVSSAVPDRDYVSEIEMLRQENDALKRRSAETYYGLDVGGCLKAIAHFGDRIWLHLHDRRVRYLFAGETTPCKLLSDAVAQARLACQLSTLKSERGRPWEITNHRRWLNILIEAARVSPVPEDMGEVADETEVAALRIKQLPPGDFWPPTLSGIVDANLRTSGTGRPDNDSDKASRAAMRAAGLEPQGPRHTWMENHPILVGGQRVDRWVNVTHTFTKRVWRKRD